MKSLRLLVLLTVFTSLNFSTPMAVVGEVFTQTW